MTSASNSPAPFLNTTEVFPEDESQLRIKLTNVYSNTSYAMNVREIAIYDKQQLLTGQIFFNNVANTELRPTYRKVFELGAIAAGASSTIAHGITNVLFFTRMYGTCVTDVVDYRPIPYADEAVVTNQISLKVVGANLVVSNGATAPNITSGIIVLEYLLG